MSTITRIIHQTWKSKILPPPFDELAQSWKTFLPDWDYILWTDEMNRNFIKEHYPAFLLKYDNYPHNIQRIDAFRYCVLNKLGGLYVDLDFECLDNIAPLLENQACVIGKEPDLHAQRFSRRMILCNAFMASAPGNDFMKYVCDEVINYPNIEVNSPVDVLNSTGPFILTDSYNKFHKKDGITILESADIYPVTMFETDLLLQKTVSEDLQKRVDRAYAIHYFLGNW
jgi:mannosyltransferase OCH1-like enzyme